VRLRLIAPVLLVIAVTAGAFALTLAEATGAAWLVLAGGLALAAVTGTLAAAAERRRRAVREVDRFFTLSPEMVIVAGFDGYWKRVNPTVEVVLGYSEREALSRPFMEFVHPDDRERTEEEARRVVGGGTALAFENRMVCKDGSSRWIEWTATPVPEEGVMYGIGRDVTARRRSEAEQTALRRVATLVAREAPQAEVFSAIAEEIGRLLGTEEIWMLRFDGNDSAVVVGSSGREDAFPIGSRYRLEAGVALRVLRTGRPARIDDYAEVGGPLAETARSIGVRAVVAAPVLVEGRLWGAMTTGSTHDEPLPADTASRLAGFTELMATAIANADAREALQRLADEQAALQRVATLVAQGVPPAELFSAVTKEVAHVFSGEEPSILASVIRFDQGPECVLVGASRPYELEPIGSRWSPKELYVSTRVLRTGRSARVDQVDLDTLGGPDADVLRLRGFLYQVGSPVVVEGRLWGAMTLNSREALPPDTDERLDGFTELVATAIANAESRDALGRLADEQAALRRVATLVARGAPSAEVFEAVANEVGRLLDTDITIVGRYDDDGAATAIGNWSSAPGGVPVGTRSVLGGRNVLTMVAETGRPARLDEYDDASGEAAEIARRHGWRSSIAAPIVVEDRLWGVMLVATRRPEPFPAGAEERLAAFTDLVSTAVANAQAQDELRRFVEEQATLRRIATLVAKGVQPKEVFAAVAEEVAATFRAIAAVLRFEDDPPRVVLAGASKEIDMPIGTRWAIDDALAAEEVYRTGRSARVDREQWPSAGGPIGEAVRRLGIVSTVASPIIVEGSRWGVIAVNGREVLPSDTEQRLEKFTELVTTAISNAASRVAIRRLADEQAALRRVATLVARGAPPEDIFAAAVNEVAGLVPVVSATMGRFEPDDIVTTVASWSTTEPAFPTGKRWPSEGKNVAWIVLQTGRSGRIDDFSDATDPIGVAAREAGYKSAVGSPIVVEGDLWGVMTATSGEGPLPPGTEARLASFTELVATAIANAESRSELAASRRRIVAASDDTRRRIERDLHDGIQQRLVSLGLVIRSAQAGLPPERSDLRTTLSGVADGLADALEDLQEISRGIHPAILSRGGVAPALATLAHRSSIPVNLDITTNARFAEPIEVAAYFVASEALANAAKHSQASRIDLSLAERKGRLLLSIRDDGVGGADRTHGSGLVGLADRVEALGGSISVHSRHGEGTEITVELPVELEVPQAAG
jgi:PAS domain S-box-containing protein